MGINVKFTVAVIAVVVIGFTASSYFFSTQPISTDWMFDKSAYIQEIDACLESVTTVVVIYLLIHLQQVFLQI